MFFIPCCDGNVKHYYEYYKAIPRYSTYIASWKQTINFKIGRQYHK